MDISLKDRFTGTMVGLGVGDALGMPSEFMREEQISLFFDNILTDYEQDPKDMFSMGEYTDDTAMAVCIAESYISEKRFVLNDIANRFLDWYYSDGRGIGVLTRSSLTLMREGFEPIDAGKQAWEKTGKQSAGNGGLMRSAPIALFNYNDKNSLISQTKLICQITHYDQKCVLSSVAYNLLIWASLHDYESTDAYELMCDACCGIDDEFDDLLFDAKTSYICDMRLDGDNMGFTYLSFMVSVSAFMMYSDFESPIKEIINKGGDSDTNAAIAGALLGARYGIDAIPGNWRTGLLGYSRLYLLGESLYDLIV